MSVRIAAPSRRGLPRVDRKRLRRRALRALDALCHRASELSIALVDDAEMAALNRRWRRRRGPTDVLAFPQSDGPLLGDVVIGVETASRQARRLGRRLDDEVARLLVHGVLHLLGHDHMRVAERRAMRAEERRLCRAIGA